MMTGSKVLREVDLQEKRTYVPFPMVEESYFSILTLVPPTIIPTVSETLLQMLHHQVQLLQSKKLHLLHILALSRLHRKV
jgi:hypothetical protein